MIRGSVSAGVRHCRRAGVRHCGDAGSCLVARGIVRGPSVVAPGSESSLSRCLGQGQRPWLVAVRKHPARHLANKVPILRQSLPSLPSSCLALVGVYGGGASRHRSSPLVHPSGREGMLPAMLRDKVRCCGTLRGRLTAGSERPGPRPYGAGTCRQGSRGVTIIRAGPARDRAMKQHGPPAEAGRPVSRGSRDGPYSPPGAGSGQSQPPGVRCSPQRL